VEPVLSAASSLEVEVDGHIHSDAEYRAVGEPTEAALRVLVEKIGLGGGSQSLPRHPRACSNYWSAVYDRLSMFEFTRERKKMSVLCRPRDTTTATGTDTGGNIHKNKSNKSKNDANKVQNKLLVKGAAEMVLDKCAWVKLEDGQVHAITTDMRRAIGQWLRELSGRPLRCVALAYCDDPRVLGRLSHATDADQVRDALRTTSSSSSSSSSSSTTTTTSDVTSLYDKYESELVLVSD
jgi:magnesium-transporting ATPase (P-type)